MNQPTVGDIFGGCRLEDLIRKTTKSFVFKARDERLDRTVAVKILEKGQGIEREQQLHDEGQRLVDLDPRELDPRELDPKELIALEHRNITDVYSAGEEHGYNYLVMEYVGGRDLDTRIEEGWKPSIGETLGILSGVSAALSYAHERGIKHRDVKLGNIAVGSGTYLLDFGGRLTEGDSEIDTNGDGSSDGPSKNDVKAIGSVAKELLNRGTKGLIITKETSEERSNNASRFLNRIVEKAIDGKYKTPKKFQKAIKRYKRGVNFKTRASILGAAALLSVSGFQAYNNHIYQSSIDQVRDRLAQVESSDPLLELTPRIADKKIKPLVEERVILPGDFPYSIPKGKTEWIPTDGTSWTSGFWPALLWRSFQTTGDPQFKEWAYEWIENMKVPEEKRRNPDEEFFTKMDNATINTIRFYYSHALGYDITKDEELKKVALSAADLMAKERFNLQGGFIQTGRRFDAYNYPRIHVDAMTTGLPLLCWAYDQSKDPQLLEKIISHCEATKDYNVNEDGSTIQVMSFSPDTEVRLGGFISHGFDEDSCLARGQARAIKGFCLAYKTTLDERFLDTAENCADYFLTNLPKDKIPDYDFKDPKPGIPKDTSAAAIAASGLLDLHEITGKPRYKTEATKILRSLSQTHLSSGNEHEGFLKNACINNNKSIEGGSVIYGGYPLFESLFRLRSYRMAH